MSKPYYVRGHAKQAQPYWVPGLWSADLSPGIDSAVAHVLGSSQKWAVGADLEALSHYSSVTLQREVVPLCTPTIRV